MKIVAVSAPLFKISSPRVFDKKLMLFAFQKIIFICKFDDVSDGFSDISIIFTISHLSR
jgi:hypothetical protein